MAKETLLKCVDCGFENSAFNVTVAGSQQGSFIYRAECPICASRKVKIIEGHETSELGIDIFLDKKPRLTKRKLR